MIRGANAVDRPALMALLEHGYKRSRYASEGKIAVKPTEQLLLGMILKNDLPAIDGTHCMVAVDKEKIVGLHFAAKHRVYHIGSKFSASDVFFYVKPGHSFDALGLLTSFYKWAFDDPRVIEILPGVTDLMQDYKIAARIYEGQGFEKCGEIFRRMTRSAA